MLNANIKLNCGGKVAVIIVLKGDFICKNADLIQTYKLP